MSGRRRSAQVPMDAQFRELWATDKINKELWCRLAAGAAAGRTIEEAPEAARMADALYIELMIRERGQL